MAVLSDCTAPIAEPTENSKVESAIHVSTRDVEDLLFKGQKEQAVELLLSKKQFSMALIIAAVCGSDVYQKAAKTFAMECLGSQSPLTDVVMACSNQPYSYIEGKALPTTCSLADVLEWKRHLCAILTNKSLKWRESCRMLGDETINCPSSDINTSYCVRMNPLLV